MMMANVALYGYLVIKPIEGIGYDLVPQFSDLKTGLQRISVLRAFRLALGILDGFSALARRKSTPSGISRSMDLYLLLCCPSGRALLSRTGPEPSGASHGTQRRLSLSLQFCSASLTSTNEPIFFNWKYVLLAAIAGFFYGRAWRERKRLLRFVHHSRHRGHRVVDLVPLTRHLPIIALCLLQIFTRLLTIFLTSRWRNFGFTGDRSKS